MVMQDGGMLDVRPGSDPGRAPREHSGAYLAAGLALALYAGALVAWVVSGVAQSDTGPLDFLEGLFNPLGGTGQPLGAQEWSLAVALAVVAGLTLAQRTVARPAALLLAFLLVGLALPQAIGLLHGDQRATYRFDPQGGWTLATHGLGLLAAAVVLCALLPLRTEPDGRADSWWRGRLARICGALFIVAGLVQTAWTVGLLTGGAGAWTVLRSALDASVQGTVAAPVATPGLTALSTPVVLLVVGAMAVRGRREVRGALIVFAAIQLYLTVRTVVGYAVTNTLCDGPRTLLGTLELAGTAYALAAMTSVLVLTTGRSFCPDGTACGTRSWARHRPE